MPCLGGGLRPTRGPPPMTRFPPTPAAIAIAASPCRGCAGDDTDGAATTAARRRASRPSSPPVAGVRAGAPGATRRHAGAVARWPTLGRRSGAGRARRSTRAPDRTVVATTIGVSVLDGRRRAGRAPRGLPVLLAVSPDGQRAAFTTAGGRSRSGTSTRSPRSPRTTSPPTGTRRCSSASADDLVAGGAGRRQPLPGRRRYRPRRSSRRRPTARSDPWRSPPTAPWPSPSVGRTGRGRVWRPRHAAPPVDMGLADGTDARRRGLVAGRAPPRRAPPTAGGRGVGRRLGRRRPARSAAA